MVLKIHHCVLTSVAHILKYITVFNFFSNYTLKAPHKLYFKKIIYVFNLLWTLKIMGKSSTIYEQTRELFTKMHYLSN